VQVAPATTGLVAQYGANSSVLPASTAGPLVSQRAPTRRVCSDSDAAQKPSAGKRSPVGVPLTTQLHSASVHEAATCVPLQSTSVRQIPPEVDDDCQVHEGPEDERLSHPLASESVITKNESACRRSMVAWVLGRASGAIVGLPATTGKALRCADGPTLRS
jgi:hypothetical protein